MRIVQRSVTLTERPNKRMQPTPKDGAADSWRSTYGECDLVLAEGPSSVTTEEVTSHLLTNRW